MRSETQALLLHLAWAQKDCPRCNGLGTIPTGDRDVQPDSCPTCDGAGKVPLFPNDVRVECKQIHNLFSQEGSSIRSASCSEVGCLGWIPSTDLMMWVKGLYQVLSLIFTRQRNRWTDEVWVCWIGYHKALIRGDFEAALPHAVKAMELIGVLEVAHEPTS